MRYLDANVFVYPALYEGPLADRAVRVLARVAAGEGAVTAALTIDEVVHAVRKRGAPEASLHQGHLVLGMPNLRVLPVTADTMRAALGLMERVPPLRPRDAVHAATAIQAGVFTIVSDDKDFDKVPGLRREPLA